MGNRCLLASPLLDFSSLTELASACRYPLFDASLEFPPLFIPINVLTLILATYFSGQQEEKINTWCTEDKLDYPTPNGSLFKENFSIHFFFPPNCFKLTSSSLQKLTLSGLKIPTNIERDLALQRGSSSPVRCT